MFNWLAQELDVIKTRRFHVVDGPPAEAAREAIAASRMPRSYKEFVLRFGGMKLYRQGDGYLVGILSCPAKEEADDGRTFYRIGHHQSSNVYFCDAMLRGEAEAPVLVGSRGRLVRAADDFEQWLARGCKRARATYSRQDWAAVVAGPPPFTPAGSSTRGATSR